MNQCQALLRVAEIDQCIAGYYILYYSCDEGELVNIAVHPNFRRQGVGRAMMADLLKMAKSLGCLLYTSVEITAQRHPKAVRQRKKRLRRQRKVQARPRQSRRASHRRQEMIRMPTVWSLPIWVQALKPLWLSLPVRWDIMKKKV